MPEMIQCPECGKKESLLVLRKMRKHYPFGRRSKPRYTVKKRIEVCTNKKEDREGRITWRCGYYNIENR